MSMLALTLQLYVQALVLALVIVLVISLLFLAGYLMRHQDLSLKERQKLLLDMALIDILCIPVLSFAFIALQVILKVR